MTTQQENLFRTKLTGADPLKGAEEKVLRKSDMDRGLWELLQYHVSKMFGALQSFLVPIVAFFAPVKGVLTTVSLFILADTITGIWKARKRKQRITSRGLSALITKMFLYQGAILLSYCLDVFILGDLLEAILSIPNLVTKSTAMLLIFIESQSINENYKIAKGVDLWAQFKNLLTRTKELKDGLHDVIEGAKPEDHNKETHEP